MKKNLLFALFVPLLMCAQTKENLKAVIENTDVETLSRLKQDFNREFLERQSRINQYLQKNPSISRRTVANGIEQEIYDVLTTGEVLYYFTSNAGSAITSRANHLYQGGSLGLNVQGQNMKVGVWDSGPVLDSHVEFSDFKITNFDFTTTSNHGTHVMGTIIANGTNASARGIAFNAIGDSYDWTNDYSEMAGAAATGLLVSNHSYWIGPGLSTWILGAYDSRARQLDEIAFAAPFYLPIAAAGNDRNRTDLPVINAQLNAKFGYDLIRGMQNAKNFLTVGAVTNVSNYIDASSVTMSSFSSWGPTDDGRIKPEVVAKGVGVFSTSYASDTSYRFDSGTSMASPAVSGSALLLQQHYHNLFNSYMRAATLKGLIIHTADESGIYDGPDYEFGWGLVNTSSAASLISNRSTNSSIIDERTLANGNQYSTTVFANGSEPLKVSISWTDRAFDTANNGVADPDTKYLVNDLDVKVTKDGIDYFPWKLNKELPYEPPTKNTTNDVDNFERIDIENPSGVYTITVSHKGSLVGGNQNYSLIVSGPQVTLSNESFNANDFAVYPNPANDFIVVTTNSLLIETASFYDVQGRLVKSITVNNESEQIRLDIQDLDSGVYILKLSSQGKEINKKIIKK
jgi:hypothetical protein